MIEFTLGSLAFVCAVISAKWAMDLGFSQLGQVLWGLAGLIGGPLVLLILYVRLLGVAPVLARRWV